MDGAPKKREYWASVGSPPLRPGGGLAPSGRAWLTLLVLAWAVAACGQPPTVRVALIADGQREVYDVTSETPFTVRDLLNSVHVTLGPLDRVQPDLYVELSDGLDITITRVEETFEKEREVIPFARETVRSEAVAEGERRLLQAGRNGEAEITWRVMLEDGQAVSRERVRRDVLTEPVNETVLVGVQGELSATAVDGTIVYLSGGNAWLMRESSDLRRNITGSGDLDGRVFALAHDGARLLFTRAMQGDESTPLNALWMARTSLVGEEPVYLGVTGVVWAAWSPDGQRLAYSTAERSGGVPGWKANNDLWLMTLPEEDSTAQTTIKQLLPATADIPYAWWGRAYAWSPDGSYLAYGQADQVGVIALADGIAVPLVSFPPLRTTSHWAWVPEVSWSPDGHLLAFVAHEGGLEGLDVQDSPVFGLWVVTVDGGVRVPLVEEVGMWSAPRFAPAGGLLVYGQAQSPRNSQDSRYELFVVDRDGSNKDNVFPPEGLMGLVGPDVAWSPAGDALLFEYEGNLYRVDLATGRHQQLTADGQSTHPRWAR